MQYLNYAVGIRTASFYSIELSYLKHMYFGDFELNGKDAYDLSLELANTSGKAVGFFITVCTLFGGWIVAGTTVKGLTPFGWERMILMSVFSGATVGMLYSVVGTFKRANAVLKIAKLRILDDIREYGIVDDVNPMFEPLNEKVPIIAMGSVIIGINLLLLLYSTYPTG